MSFWAISKDIEPFKQHRWSIAFLDNDPAMQDKILFFALKEASKPEYDISFTEHRLLTQTFKYPGLLKWKPISIKLISTIDEKKTLDKILYNRTLNMGYKSPRYDKIIQDTAVTNDKIDVKGTKDNTNDDETFTSEFMRQYPEAIYGSHQNISKKDSSLEIFIDQYDVEGAIIQTWKLYNCFISNISYGKLAYASEEFVEISLTIQYDYAIEEELGYFNSKAREEARLKNEREAKEKEKQIEAERLRAEKEAAQKAEQRAEQERQKRLREDFEISRYLKDNPNERANLEKTEEGKRKLAEIEKNAEQYQKQQDEQFKQQEEQERKRKQELEQELEQLKQDAIRKVEEEKEQRVKGYIEQAEKEGAERRQKEVDRLLGEARKSARSELERNIERQRDELPVTGVDKDTKDVIRSPLADPRAEAERKARVEAEYRTETQRVSKLTKSQAEAEAEAKQRDFAKRGSWRSGD